MFYRLLSGVVLGTAVSFGALAQDLQKLHFKAIGLNGPTVASMVDEVPFWRQTMPKASNGAITTDITPLDQMGIDDKTMLRLLRLGVMDFAGMDISKMAGDDPRFEGCDLAGLTLDTDRARAACDAYRGVIDRQMQKNWNAKLLAFGGNPPQVFWCRGMIGGLSDLKGKKIRVFNNTMRDFLAGVPATRRQALERGIRLIEWTFDPLEWKNAVFNFNRLGAIARRYVPNQYGVSSSPLHRGLPTDRLIAEWWLDSPRVVSCLEGKSDTSTEAGQRIALPLDVLEHPAERASSIADLQASLRAQFQQAFAKGLAAVAFEPQKDSGSYLLTDWRTTG